MNIIQFSYQRVVCHTMLSKTTPQSGYKKDHLCNCNNYQEIDHQYSVVGMMDLRFPIALTPLYRNLSIALSL